MLAGTHAYVLQSTDTSDAPKHLHRFTFEAEVQHILRGMMLPPSPPPPPPGAPNNASPASTGVCGAGPPDAPILRLSQQAVPLCGVSMHIPPCPAGSVAVRNLLKPGELQPNQLIVLAVFQYRVVGTDLATLDSQVTTTLQETFQVSLRKRFVLYSG